MQIRRRNNSDSHPSWCLVLMFGILSAAGCNGNGPKTHALKGTVKLPGGDIQVLAGSFVEAAAISNPEVRASGVIQPDGSFQLGTPHGGSVVNGAVEGKYQVRIVLADDDIKLQQQAAKVISRRFLDFKTSGLVIEVPSSGDVTIQLASR